MKNPTPSLDRLIHEFQKLPGVGAKTAERLAYFILRNNSNLSHNLAEALVDVHEKIQSCSECFCYTESDLCPTCADSSRDRSVICVVEDPSDIYKVQSSTAFHGVFHVLQGAISPLDGILPENLKIKELFERIKTQEENDSPVKEVILALDADIEGDTTALYIAKHLKTLDIKVTRLAHGVPFGTDIDYIDQRTLGRALENRVEL